MAKITLHDLGHSYVANPKADADWALKPLDLIANVELFFLHIRNNTCEKSGQREKTVACTTVVCSKAKVSG